MASLLGLLNRLLPFATPGTPVLQDVLHLAAICALLYYAPQIQERLQNPTARPEEAADEGQEDQHDRAGNVNQDQDDPGDQDAEVEREAAVDGEGPQAAFAANEQVDGDAGEIAEGQAGPVRQPLIPEQRNVGAKKAKALARRDQRRAYHEFQRSQGDAQRARDAEGAEEREKAQAAERERRKAAEAAFEAKKTKEREVRRTKEEAERAEEQRRREQAVELVRSRLEGERMCDLFRVAREVGVDDEEWVERILRSSGMIGRRGDEVTMITSVGWAVRVGEDDMRRLYDELLLDDGASDENGLVDPENCGRIMERTLRDRAGAVMT